MTIITITEVMMEELADLVKMDPVEFRIKNLPPEAPNAMWATYLRRGATEFGWDKRHPTGDKTPGPIKTGMGVAINTWGGGGRGPSQAHCQISSDGGVVVRIGTQELVFCELAEGSGPVVAKTTGFLRHCARCRLPYPQELVACPSCGETVQLEEDTMTGQLGADTSRAWGLQLLLEVLEKAVGLGRVPDAARALQRIQAQVEERLVAGERLDPKQLDEVARAGCAVALATRDAGQVIWVLRVYPRANLIPAGPVTEAIGEVALAMREEMRGPVADLIAWVRMASDQSQLKRLEQVVAAMDASDLDPDRTTRNPVLA